MTALFIMARDSEVGAPGLNHILWLKCHIARRAGKVVLTIISDWSTEGAHIYILDWCFGCILVVFYNLGGNILILNIHIVLGTWYPSSDIISLVNCKKMWHNWYLWSDENYKIYFCFLPIFLAQVLNLNHHIHSFLKSYLSIGLITISRKNISTYHGTRVKWTSWYGPRHMEKLEIRMYKYRHNYIKYQLK